LYSLYAWFAFLVTAGLRSNGQAIMFYSCDLLLFINFYLFIFAL